MTIAANQTTAANAAPADQRATPASGGQPGHPLSLDSLVPPHGGRLVNRIVSVGDAPALRERAAALPRLTLHAREIADLELIATGAASPLTGFLGSADYARVLS